MFNSKIIRQLKCDLIIVSEKSEMQQKAINELKAEYNELKAEYNELLASFKMLSDENAQLRNKLDLDMNSGEKKILHS